MANVREQIKRNRIEKLSEIIAQTKKEKKIIDKNKLVSMMIVKYAISKKTAIEEIEAVMNYDFH